MDRILAWIHPYDYVDKISYQQVQGLLAIGSGGLFGKGVHGIEVYVPVRESDMVLLLSGKPGALWAVPPLFFSILLVLSSFSSWLAEQFAFCMYICVALIFSLVFQTVENIGAVIGLLPLKVFRFRFKSRRHFVSDGYHFFRICQRKRSRYLKTQ